MARQKTPAQLDAEIAAALATPAPSAAMTPRPKKRAAVPWADINVLAQAISFGEVTMDDLAPPARTASSMSKTYRKKTRAAYARLRSLADRGLLEGQGFLGEKYVITETGRQVLVDAGYAPNAGGSWIKPGARRPTWSL
jgi:hypothetical protein